jgi:cytochrome c nitrite reductase small subunit
MPTQLRHIYSDLLSVLADPRADPQKTVLFIGLGTVLILILIVVVLAIVTTTERRPEEKRRRRRRFVRGYLVVGLIALFAGFYIAANEAATNPTVCVRCHEIEPSVASWRSSTHKGTDCMGCHDRPGVTGHIATRLVALENLVRHARGGKLPTTAEPAVGNEGCIHCHKDQLQGVTESAAIRVRHADFVETGTRCTECHGEAGHGPALGRTVPTMDKCVTCHDGSRAPSNCDTCHLSDVATLGDIPSNYPKTQLDDPATCEGCHPLDGCKECHRIDMPHPANFGDPALHAPLAAFEKKDEICLRCHKITECATCHEGIDVESGRWGPHGPEWKSGHQVNPPDGEWCRGCHNGAANMCLLCHPK